MKLKEAQIVGELPDGIRPTIAGALWLAQRGQCFYCGEMMLPRVHNSQRRPNGWTRDHLRPARHGWSKVNNIVLAHQRCNQLKDDSDPTDEEVKRMAAIHEIADAYMRQWWPNADNRWPMRIGRARP